jgi:hypothetical protein
MEDRRKPQLSELLKEGPDTLAKDVESVDGLDPDQYEAMCRALEIKESEHWLKRIKPCLNWAKFYAICFVIFVLSFMICSWLWFNFQNTESLSRAFGFLWDWAMVGGAVLYADSVARPKK